MGKIGRNDTCPCGSGKKYKKCCGATLPTGVTKTQAESAISFNRDIAYVGVVGRRREGFCKRFLEHKRKQIEAINAGQRDETLKRGQTVSCHEGCAFCCNEFVEASLGECELIVFYLYQNEVALNMFIKAFPSWLEQTQKHPDIFNRIEQAQRNTFASRMSDESMQQLGTELRSYWDLQIPCPFLIKNACSIYEVRPWACTSVFSVTPSEWCSPVTKEEPKIYWTRMPPEIQIPFYDSNASLTPPDRNMPDTIYRILIGGFRLFSEIPGLESLYQEFMRDDEVIKWARNRIKK